MSFFYIDIYVLCIHSLLGSQDEGEQMEIYIGVGCLYTVDFSPAMGPPTQSNNVPAVFIEPERRQSAGLSFEIIHFYQL